MLEVERDFSGRSEEPRPPRHNVKYKLFSHKLSVEAPSEMRLRGETGGWWTRYPPRLSL